MTKSRMLLLGISFASAAGAVALGLFMRHHLAIGRYSSWELEYASQPRSGVSLSFADLNPGESITVLDLYTGHLGGEYAWEFTVEGGSPAVLQRIDREFRNDPVRGPSAGRALGGDAFSLTDSELAGLDLARECARRAQRFPDSAQEFWLLTYQRNGEVIGTEKLPVTILRHRDMNAGDRLHFFGPENESFIVANWSAVVTFDDIARRDLAD